MPKTPDQATGNRELQPNKALHLTAFSGQNIAVFRIFVHGLSLVVFVLGGR
jgi:hypothetical protein